MIPATKPYFDNEQINSVLENIRHLLETGTLISGANTTRFETQFASYTGVMNAITVNTCTTALTICLRNAKTQNKEVIVPSATFIATPNAAIYAGAKPVFADINKDTLCLSEETIKEKLTPQTAAVVLVHLLGIIPPEIHKIRRLCKEEGIALIEDCAHAAGSSLDGKKAGSFGDAGCFSFYPTKTMTAGLGGMITTNDDELKEFAKTIRNHGAKANLFRIDELGQDGFLSEIHCAVGLSQLDTLDKMIKLRNSAAFTYDNLLAKEEDIQTFNPPTGAVWNYYRYPVRIDGSNIIGLCNRLKTKYGIGAAPVYLPCHKQPIYKKYSSDKLPETEHALSSVICLPMYPSITTKEIEYVCDTLRKEAKTWKKEQ